MTELEGAIHAKPPRPPPVPFGAGPRSASDSNVLLLHEESTGAQSTGSRGALRAAVHKRRTSLTPQELGFLEELIVHGNEVEVTVARETLCDTDLFFDDNNGWGDDISLGISEENNGSLTAEELESIFRTSQRLRSGSETTFGSAKRQEHLDMRRKSQNITKIWKAHEHGVPIITGTRQRSKSIACLREEKSNAVRRSSFMSQETADLLANGGPLMKEGDDGVFRRQSEDRVFRKPLSPKARVNNDSRKVSWDKAGAQKLLKATRPASLRRLESGGSRKSVSFAEYDENGDHPTRLPGIPRRVARKRNVSTDTEISALETELDDEPSIPSLHHGRPVRSESISSIHSLHHGRPIRSESVSSIPSLHLPETVRSESVWSIPSLHHPNPVRSDSVSSIPSLHHPNPLRSDSVASIHSIHHAHRIHSNSNLPTEDVDTSNEDVDTSNEDVNISMISEVSLMTTPSLHHGHPLRDESLASFTSSPETREPEQEETKMQLLRHPAQPQQRPVLMRRATVNNYEGEGIELEELPPEMEYIEFDAVQKARKYKSLISFGETTTGSVLTCSSFDQAVNRESIFRDHRRSLSDEGRSMFFLGSASKFSNDASELV